MDVNYVFPVLLLVVQDDHHIHSSYCNLLHNHLTVIDVFIGHETIARALPNHTSFILKDGCLNHSTKCSSWVFRFHVNLPQLHLFLVNVFQH